MLARLHRWLLPLALLVGAPLALRVCNLLFGCGCTWAWAGGEAHCNVHHATGPHCPWCANGRLGFALVALVTVAAGWLALRLGERATRGSSDGRRLVVGALTVGVGLSLGALVAGLGAALVSGYPTFLGLALRR